MPVCQRCGEDNPERARFCRPAAPLTALTIREAIAEINQADPTLDLHVRIG